MKSILVHVYSGIDNCERRNVNNDFIVLTLKLWAGAPARQPTPLFFTVTTAQIKQVGIIRHQA